MNGAAATGNQVPLRLAYFSQETFGGLADYAREQVQALERAGASVSFVTAPSVAKTFGAARQGMVPILAEVPSAAAWRSKLGRRFRSLKWLLGNMRALARWIEVEKPQCVLMGAYMEYLAPFWAGRFLRSARQGVVFGSVIHDPVRKGLIGPAWWHRRSVGDAYSFLSEAFIHDPIDLDTGRPMKRLRTTVIPHGPYPFAPATLPREAVRSQLGIPADGVLMLSFGHLRDGKNLDLALRAMVSNPSFHLLVAGKEQSKTQRPAKYYQDLAVKLGVADRCRWKIGFMPENEIGNSFEASDLVLLTYEGGFRSASGVLNVAAQFRKPCIASGGEGNLRTSVLRYGLGLWIEPDSADAMVRGLEQWTRLQLQPGWSAYSAENSWERNAELVIDRFASHRARVGRNTVTR